MTVTLSQLHQKIGFIGGGNMATALIGGLLEAGISKSQIVATDIDSARLTWLTATYGITTKPDAAQLVVDCDVVFLAVKPAVVVPVLQQLRPHSDRCLWISIAAGVPLSHMEQALGNDARVVRAMPNTPALVARGATGLSGGKYTSVADVELAAQLLGAVGITEEVSESLMDAVTGLSGSGPAYIMLVIEALADGGVRAGLPRKTAMALATQTVLGSAELLQKTQKHPGELKDMVTSPGGTTICGVEVLEQRGLRGALIGAVLAATEQSKRLSQK